MERKALSVRLLHRWSRAAVCFDEENLVSCAGLVPVMALAERAGLSELVGEKVEITNAPIPSTGANPAGKVAAIVTGMAAGADSIDDLDVIRHGGMKRLFGGVYARHWARFCGRSPTGTSSSWRWCCGRCWCRWRRRRRCWPGRIR
jgi:hypothetical protein